LKTPPRKATKTTTAVATTKMKTKMTTQRVCGRRLGGRSTWFFVHLGFWESVCVETQTPEKLRKLGDRPPTRSREFFSSNSVRTDPEIRDSIWIGGGGDTRHAHSVTEYFHSVRFGAKNCATR
jgi:hypothetical protein